ncbi:MAG: ABC transporter substrate-binding protein [Gemmatimonadota bacterium]
MRRVGLWLGLAAATLALGCSEGGGEADRASWSPQDVPESARYGGTLVVGGTTPIESMNGLVSTGSVALQHEIHVLFATLVRLDPDFLARPYLARSWEVSDDGTQVVFHLRDDLSWHDGTPVTARDVQFTFDRAKDPRVEFPNRSYFDLWEATEVLDDHTIRFYLRPHNGFLYGWARTPIMPRHILASVAPEDLRSHPFGVVRPVGSGPYRFVEHVAGDRWVFEANPDFPDELGGRPYVDRLVYREIPDPTTLLAELRTGGVDVAVDVPPALVRRIRSDSTLTVVSYPVADYTFIAWNTRRPVLSDPLVRRAITMAIDREAILASVREGFGTVAAGPVGPWHWAYDTAWTPLPFDPDSARKLLDGAGWTRSPTGVRERDGVPLRLEILTNPSEERRDIAVIVQASLRAIGIDVRTRVVDPATLGATLTSPDRRFDGAVIGWARDVLLDDRDLWACDQLGQPFQFTSYCNPVLDPVLDSIPLTTDRARLEGLIRRYERIVAEDQPYTFLYYNTQVNAYRSRVHGLAFDARGDWTAASRWWLDPRGRRGTRSEIVD